MFHISFYVPVSHAEKVKESMFAAGAGKVGNYDKCSFEFKGIGQFRPLADAHPFVGQLHQVETVEELKVEMVCEKEYLKATIEALKSSHPYETPAFYVLELITL